MTSKILMLEELIETSTDEAIVKAAQKKLAEIRAEVSEQARAAEAQVEAILVDAEIRERNEKLRKPIIAPDGVRDRVPGGTR